jgi:hypothetical protein
MNAIVTEFLICFILFISFGIIPIYVCCSHNGSQNDNINQDCYLILDEIPNRRPTEI